ncbi:MAG: hypothetical protein IT207_05315 [Fimbriimonadaceae bacterium]|nr:hypothetical protein [Fimbriimonadaceae bacterium]
MRARWLASVTAAALAATGQCAFTSNEVAQVLKYWSEPKRNQVSPLLRDSQEWVAQISPTGSEYLLRLYRLYGSGKVAPTRVPVPPTIELALWEGWAHRKYDFDKHAAQAVARAKNLGDVPLMSPQFAEPMPAGMAERLGEAPVMVEAVRPNRYRFVFHDGVKVEFGDCVRVRDRYPYYRAHSGVATMGTKARDLPDSELTRACNSAGLSASERRVLLAVSLLEGGFDSVNTYDTGLVSAGFIQFACLKGGSGSLGTAMLSYKERTPTAFTANFKKLGLDVTPGGELQVVRLGDGKVVEGPAAADAIVADPRLAAVFVRAGRVCPYWRGTQLRSAKRLYLPQDERVIVHLGGFPYSIRVGDVIRSEAGLATLTERKVNTGNLGDLGGVLSRIATIYGVTDPLDLPAVELPVVRAATYRKDFLLEANLGRPREVDVAAYRKGRRSRGG